jgi:hypothetical protein
MSSTTNPFYLQFLKNPRVQARITELQRIRDAYLKKKQQEEQSMRVNLLNERLLARVLEQIQELVSQARTYVHAQEQAQARALQQAQADFLAQKQAQEEAKALERQKNNRKRHADEAPLRVVFKRRQSTRGREEYSEVAVVYVQQENGRKRRGDDVEELPDLPQRKQQRSRSY